MQARTSKKIKRHLKYESTNRIFRNQINKTKNAEGSRHLEAVAAASAPTEKRLPPPPLAALVAQSGAGAPTEKRLPPPLAALVAIAVAVIGPGCALTIQTAEREAHPHTG